MTLRIALAGAGLIGRRHADALAVARGGALCAVADPAPAGAELAARYAVNHHATLDALIAAERPDGVILATPNQMHLGGAQSCIAAGIPALIEKPLATTVADAEAIVAAGHAAGVPLLIGHHRRHNPLIRRARELIDDGQLGRITAVQGTAWLCKPDDYFETAWRREPGGGPIFINLSHDIDLLRHLVGEVSSVHAMSSNAVRGFAPEDTAAIILRFDGGALGTISLSDTVTAPFSWELTARENPAYPATDQACYLIGGTNGSLALPNLTLWSNPGLRGWWEPISATRVPQDHDDPLVAQINQFADVIRGEAAPLVPARDGLQNQRVIEAILTSAASGQTVEIPRPACG